MLRQMLPIRIPPVRMANRRFCATARYP